MIEQIIGVAVTKRRHDEGKPWAEQEQGKGVAESVKKIPLEKILLETDSPYLTPMPFRGKRNESSYIPLIARKVAELKDTDLDEVAAKTTENACKLFRISI